MKLTGSPLFKKGLIYGIPLFLLLSVLYLLYFNQINDPYVTILGKINLADGIGRQSVELAKDLMNEFPTQLVPTNKFKDHLPSKIKQLCAKKINPRTKIVIYEDPLWYASEGNKIPIILHGINSQDTILIAYSMFESTRIPPEWVFLLNTSFDAVVVPDEFLLEVYEKSGVRIPIFHIPLLIDLKNFLSLPIKKARNPIMCFANLSSGDLRKNQVILIRAFAKALGNVKDAMLCINMRHCDPDVRVALNKELLNAGCSNILLTELCLSTSQYINFFRNVDCYVSLSTGEGFSIQPREAMALGIPVIVTDSTAQSTISKSQLVRSVSAPIPQLAKYPLKLFSSEELGYQFNCNEEDAVAAIRYIYDHYDDCLKQSEQARIWAARYDFSNLEFSKNYRTLIAPQKIFLGEKNKIDSDRLETNSKVLFEKYQRVCGCSE